MSCYHNFIDLYSTYRVFNYYNTGSSPSSKSASTKRHRMPAINYISIVIYPYTPAERTHALIDNCGTRPSESMLKHHLAINMTIRNALRTGVVSFDIVSRSCYIQLHSYIWHLTPYTHDPLPSCHRVLFCFLIFDIANLVNRCAGVASLGHNWWWIAGDCYATIDPYIVC